MINRPLCGPYCSWIPTPGPVAYQPQVGSFTDAVMLEGVDHARPSSLLCNSQTVRSPLVFFDVICFSFTAPGLWVASSKMLPVVWSTTAQGLPQVLSPSSQIDCCSLHVFPASRERFIRRSMSPESPGPFLRPSQKASNVPFFVTIKEGIRYERYPSFPPTKRSC